MLQKYTLESGGIGEFFRRFFTLEPNRSSGVPLVSQFRNPSPGALHPLSYDDPVTLPAADIADNPYWKRDVRRNYPQLSTVKQSDVVGLLTVGSKAAPKDDVLQLGEAGSTQLAAVKQEGEEHGLASHLNKDSKVPAGILSPEGLPPMPTNLRPSATKYILDDEQPYPDSYVPFLSHQATHPSVMIKRTDMSTVTDILAEVLFSVLSSIYSCSVIKSSCAFAPCPGWICLYSEFSIMLPVSATAEGTSFVFRKMMQLMHRYGIELVHSYE